MSARWDGQKLLQPITAEQPCGENLEDTELLSSFDTFGVFGQSTPLDAPPAPGEKRTPKPLESPVWREIQTRALEALGKSKDLRILAYLGTALLRTEGLLAFVETLKVASTWLETDWKGTYPPVDEDAILRRNALNCFADPMAVIEGLRRAPLVVSPQHGRFSLRDVEVAAGQVQAGAQDVRASEGQINAAFEEMPIDELRSLQDGLAGALATLQRIDARTRQEGGPEAAPSFDLLSGQFTKLARVVRTHLARRAGGEGGETEGEGERPPVGLITSRQDATRALDAIAEFFRRNEPSSPIPLIVERAKRLVAKDFLEVLADIAPDALAQARTASGLREGE